ncbi:MAG TPA: aminoglycoside adenylyltransferase domain-containing protein [Paracoccus sp. (in: a-proteobacteria)]|uniref:aminoglycoside adenylyltransferase domain-containing protein n=1 Tax=Paracoccus sp. TaxID=267 RepID=UPI002D142687|nr:aminoglycoside adenylyltransferase domain-containing protein [Paracoccus sp. (in: a-proteobacteria)]HWL58943.1 aminoglycoside adenylyltransferase domain-containing protein [Paracoccus sp. (in: a-proteobacteria)]
MPERPELTTQVSATLAEIRRILGNDLLAVYLHGSAVAGGLRPQSDIDLLAVVDRGPTGPMRAELLSSLLRLSGRHPAPPEGPRCLEVMVFSRPDLADRIFPARAEFVYGEWLRPGFEAGEVPLPARDPEFTLALAQARGQAIPLLGPAPEALLPEVSAAAVRRAMRDLLPALLEGLHQDTRNVLLTLARMWLTTSKGIFASKDEAAIWAIQRLGAEDAAILDIARRGYVGEIADDWSGRREDAQRLADQMARHLGE